MSRPPRPLHAPPHLSQSEYEVVAAINSSASAIAAARTEQVAASDYVSSKRAWKLKTYQISLIYRVVSLFDGAVVASSASSPLVALLAARALMETVALIGESVVRTRTRLAGGPEKEFDDWLFQRIFATRDEAFLALADEGMPSTKATSILTILAHLEKNETAAAGFREIYDQLSEFCHPNAFGHHFMFGKLDTAAHTVSYSDEQDPTANFGLLLTALASIEFVAEWLLELEAQVAAIMKQDSGEELG